MLIFRAKWEQMLGGCVSTNCLAYDSMVIAESEERAKLLINKRFGPSVVKEMTLFGEATNEHQQEGFFLTQSQAICA